MGASGEAATEIRVPRLVIGGVTSGVGKTTFVAGLIGALRQRGLRVAPFKVGPDYIDPSYHTRMAGLPCRNLDSWMVPREAMLELFARSTDAADMAVVEGVMGLFDGRNGREEDGSTAQVAKLLGAPTVLVVNVAKTSRSAGAIVLGFRQFDPELQLAGVVLNNVGSAVHRECVREAVQAGAAVPVLGHLPRRDGMALPERHLGLIPTAESAPCDDFFDRLVHQVEANVNVDELLAIARSADTLAVRATGLFPNTTVEPEARIGVAMDRAFTFYYEDNLDLLRAWGAELVPFSPLDDRSMPEGIHGLYLGGGFPELFTEALAANRTMLDGIRAACAAGMPIYAECGGLMYLCESLGDPEGRRHSMAGLVPAAAVMRGGRVALGYAEVRARCATILLEEGDTARGHEFHWSALEPPVDGRKAAYELGEGSRREGYSHGGLLASYIHLHFASNPRLAANFVAACRRFGGRTC